MQGMAIYTTWINTIAHWPASGLGPVGVYVNMSFSRDSQWGRVFIEHLRGWATPRAVGHTSRKLFQ